MTCAHMSQNAHTRSFPRTTQRCPAGVRPPTGAHQWGVPAIAVISTFVSETTCTDIEVKRLGVLFLRVQPLCKTLLPLQDDPGRDQSFAELPSSTAVQRKQQCGGEAGSKNTTLEQPM